MSDHLLPPNSTAQERGLSLAIERAGAVPVAVRDVWDPATCPAALLPWLAWAMSVDEWDSAWSEAQKRDTIRASIVVHRYKGTIGAVLDALGALGVSALVQEWFNQSPPADPYTFRIHMESDQYGITSDEQAKLLRVLERTKNLRSHLQGIDLVVKTATGPVVAAASSVGSHIVLPPYTPPAAVDVLSVVAAPAVSEGTSVLAYVTLSSAAGAPAIPFSVGGVSAADLGFISFSAGVTRAGFSLAVPSGVSGFIVAIPVLEDPIYEPGETLYINVGGQTAAVAITDTSVPPTVLSITAAGGATSFNEGASATFTVLLSNSYGWAGIPFGITGVSGADMGAPTFTAGVTLAGGLLTIPPGVGTFGVSVPLVADLTTEGPETLTISVGAQSLSVTVADTSIDPPEDAPISLGAVLWVDPSNPSAVTLNETGRVQSVKNLATGADMPNVSGSDDAVLHSATTSMQYITSLSDGHRNGWVIDGGGITLGKYTLFAVVRINTEQGSAARSICWINNGQLSGGGVASAGAFYAESGGSSSAYAPGASMFIGGVSRGDLEVPTASKPMPIHVAVTCVAGSVAGSTIRENGMARTGLQGGGEFVGPVTYTHVQNQITYHMTGYYMGEWFVVPRECSPSEIEQAEAYLMAKWGIA